MQHPTGAIHVRSAAASDLIEVRALVTRALLEAGYDPPSPERDADLHDPAYFEAEGRSLWVAIDDGRNVVGCIAVDTGDEGTAVLRRLAGDALYALIAAAVQFARRHDYRVAEAVLTPGMEQAQRALETEGFSTVTLSGPLLYRRELTPE